MKPRMTFSGASLQMVRYGLGLAIDELHNQIATCPDVNHYGADIDACEAEIVILEHMCKRVDKKLEGAKK